VYGQETGEIIPRSFNPERYPTRAEQAKWAELVHLVDQAGDKTLICRLLVSNAAAGYFWGRNHGIDIPKPADIETRVLDAESKFDNLLNLIRRVEDNELSVQFNKGDIDIVDPSQNLDGFLLIAGGAVLVIGAVALASWIWNELDDCERELRIINGATDKVFCEQGTPETCAEWKAYKVEARIDERQKLADDIGSGLGAKLKTGAQWGIAIAIPLILLAFLWRRK
jgi:hypothetical protein